MDGLRGHFALLPRPLSVDRQSLRDAVPEDPQLAHRRGVDEHRRLEADARGVLDDSDLENDVAGCLERDEPALPELGARTIEDAEAPFGHFVGGLERPRFPTTSIERTVTSCENKISMNGASGWNSEIQVVAGSRSMGELREPGISDAPARARFVPEKHRQVEVLSTRRNGVARRVGEGAVLAEFEFAVRRPAHELGAERVAVRVRIVREHTRSRDLQHVSLARDERIVHRDRRRVRSNDGHDERHEVERAPACVLEADNDVVGSDVVLVGAPVDDPARRGDRQVDGVCEQGEFEPVPRRISDEFESSRKFVADEQGDAGHVLESHFGGRPVDAIGGLRAALVRNASQCVVRGIVPARAR